LTAIGRAVEVNSPYVIEIQYSASFLSQRNQKQHDADRRENDCGGETHGRNFGTGMIVFFQLRGEAYQETKKPNAEHYQPNRSLIVARDFHGCGNPI
jgi:hypothetical protein